MKKILAIMLIAVIAVAGVFATIAVEGPTGVTLKYNITDNYKPSILLTAVSYKSDGTSNVATETKKSANFSILAGANQDRFAAGSVKFSIVDATYANAITDKTLKIKVSCSDNWVNSLDNTQTGPSIEESGITAVDATGSTNAILTGADEGKLQLTYPQNTVLDRTTNHAEVGTFNVSWDADADTEHRAAATWVATVTLEFEAN